MADDSDDDFSLDPEELRAIEIKTMELKRTQSINKAVPPPPQNIPATPINPFRNVGFGQGSVGVSGSSKFMLFKSGIDLVKGSVRPLLVPAPSLKVTENNKTNDHHLKKNVVTGLEDLDMSDLFSEDDDCLMVDFGVKAKEKTGDNINCNIGNSVGGTGTFKLLEPNSRPPTSIPLNLQHQAKNQPPKPLPLSLSKPLAAQPLKPAVDIINLDDSFDDSDFDCEELQLAISNSKKLNHSSNAAQLGHNSSSFQASNSHQSNLPSSSSISSFPSTNSTSIGNRHSNSKPNSNMKSVQTSLLNFMYKPPTSADPNAVTDLTLERDKALAPNPITENSGGSILRPGITNHGHYIPPRNCYEAHHDYVPLLHCPLAVETWIYPTNYPMREYQFNIVQKALHENTLVSLPTGLGKTFIAAVVMYNFYRWFPKMKVVFTAPTKPLVAQQIEACYNVCGITQRDSVELTGAQSQATRVDSWKTKRVFYLTPQVMQNDLESGLVDARDVACIVIDEAHRAQKAYAYVNVVKALYQKNPLVRVLALSATPGTTLDNVQAVVTNLNIARIEFRTEDALDLRPYAHGKDVEKIIVPPGPDIEEMAAGMKKLISPYLEKLRGKGAFWSNNPDQANVYQLLQARIAFRAKSSGGWESGVAEGEFAICISLLRMLELLDKYGFTTFYSKLQEWVAEAGVEAPKYRKQLTNNPMFIELLRKTESIINAPDYHLSFKSHPKVGHLYQYLKRHFENNEEAALDGTLQTKVMIFAQFRETIEEIITALGPLHPAVRPMAFIGQATSKSGKGLKQKDQIEVISKFKKGGYNVLVCTSIGEEGLDIGEVDLIVCYDSSNSPIRMLQRIGRTGRRRKGRVCMLLTQGKEERSFGTSKSTHKAVLKGISSGKIQYYCMNPRMLPEGVIPRCVQTKIDITPYQAPTTSKTSRSRKAEHGLTPDELDHFYAMFGAAIPIYPSLTRFPVRQCHPGYTHTVGHSSRTKTFVEIMRQCDSAINDNDSLIDTSHLLMQSNPTPKRPRPQTLITKSTAGPSKRVTPPSPPPKPAATTDFLEGIIISSDFSDDELLVLEIPPRKPLSKPTPAPKIQSLNPPPKIQPPLPKFQPPKRKIKWDDIDSRAKLIFARHAALAKRNLGPVPKELPNLSVISISTLDSSGLGLDGIESPSTTALMEIDHVPFHTPIQSDVVVKDKGIHLPVQLDRGDQKLEQDRANPPFHKILLDDKLSATQTPLQPKRRRPRPTTMILSGTPSPQPQPTRKKRRRIRMNPKAKDLLELEAEVSGDEGASTEKESTSGDDTNDSFVCGDGEVIREGDEETNMTAIYRQSLMTQDEEDTVGFQTRPNQFGPQKPNLRYVLTSKKKPALEDKSQHQNDSQYQEDSFIVDDDEPMETGEWTQDEDDDEMMDEEQINAKLTNILEESDEASDSDSPSSLLSSKYPNKGPGTSSIDRPPPLWYRKPKK